MELNGALSNPLEKGKTALARLHKLVCDLSGRRAQSLTPLPLPPRREPLGVAAEAVVRAADRPVRVAEVSAALGSAGYQFEASAVRKVLHARASGSRSQLCRVGFGLYACLPDTRT